MNRENTNKLKSLVATGTLVHFKFYRAGFFFFAVADINDNYEFPVPVEDIGNATINRYDRAITYMRWIRKAIEDGTLIKQPTGYEEKSSKQAKEI